MTDETYEGWTNKETWATALWIDNDQGLHNWKNELLTRFKRELDNIDTDQTQEEQDSDQRGITRKAGEAIKTWVEDELFNEESDSYLLDTKEGRMMRDEIGSLWRVEWTELAEHWLED